MQLDLAIAVECTPTACRVRTLDGNVVLDAHYGALVQDRIKVRPGDLVVLDTGVQPPEVVWRWRHGTVQEVNGDQVKVTRNVSQARPEDPRAAALTGQLPSALVGQVNSGDTVFLTHVEEEHRVLDVAREGNPAHLEQLREELLPEVRTAYGGMTGA